MMLYPAMNKLTGFIPNRYMLVNVVARRARQIAEAAEAEGEHLDEKPVTMAIYEVAGGKLDASAMDLTIEEPQDNL
ncbi:DNA-directed RNA polymerase subunit omega [Oscillibacter sp.]|uniref:DNA-directed RNA polymerase subunit omega n=1 Tax=Oscillibacter sp. TaxID=1945593 RepID=UPI002625697C|nr:DNA-directed RNA polymerase subunit omega [Oscillibacter sp.]MDD3346312.1 DNA-directed RNA polymerase subunit omega [Oscillibacter sp.]